jgi:D-glycero-alpha-D-manno-heptose-7-phosphate kinase
MNESKENIITQNIQNESPTSSSITNTEIDDIYSKGIRAGAVGGKLLGAGGGGFMLFLTPPEKQKVVAYALG